LTRTLTQTPTRTLTRTPTRTPTGTLIIPGTGSYKFYLPIVSDGG
jgi:hypothetical protein